VLGELASSSPAPGGGSAAALAGAMAAGLCAMAARLTLGREVLRERWPEMERIRDEADGLAARLQDLAEEDAAAFDAVMQARRLPRGTPPEQEARAAAVQAAVLRCAEVPLQTLRAVLGTAELAAAAVKGANPACLTDAGTAAALARAGAAAAAYNVRINLRGITDPGRRAALAGETAAALARVEELAARAAALVEIGLE
jgi:methenyltetrahydrofolate cyclohydrolase